MSEGGTFLLGTGAQKAATSWVHAYIDGCPGANLGPIKEYHVWDALSVEAFQQDTETYCDFFDTLLKQHGIRITGDFTPSYSALSRPTLEEIKDGFLRRSIQTRAVLIVRDPVDRAWSAVRMNFRRNDTEVAAQEGIDVSLEPEAALLEYIQTEQARLRGNYAMTLSNLLAVFSADDLFLGCFETLFTKGELNRLSEFLQFPPRPEALANRVHAYSETRPLNPSLRLEVAGVFRDVYEYFEAQYPAISAVWRDRHGSWK